jgi:hypothetical protein
MTILLWVYFELVVYDVKPALYFIVDAKVIVHRKRQA